MIESFVGVHIADGVVINPCSFFLKSSGFSDLYLLCMV